MTQHDATEPPFDNAYWNHHEPGIYVDVVSGEPLFSSIDKFDSGTGWPSFTKPLEPEQRRAGPRGDARADGGGSAKPGRRTATSATFSTTGRRRPGLRYCIDSAALRFVPVAELDSQGLGEYKRLFRK